MTAPLLVIGQTGQLARAIARLDHQTICLPRDQMDLSWEDARLRDAFTNALNTYHPHGVINAAAYTQVDKAETDATLAFAVNGTAPGHLAQICASQNLPFVHISTDYVFNGQNDRPWREGDDTDPLNVYGDSKLAGEKAVLDTNATAAILRTSWVYDLQGRNFATTMLRLAEERDHLTIVDDQLGRPTHADDLAAAALSALGHKGIFHVSGTGEPVSWAGFAKAIFDEAQLCVEVEPIPTSAFPTPAKRPAWSVLDTSRFEQTVAPLRDWRTALKMAFRNR